MLLSLAHKFLFVANVKTASSSIEATLAPLAEIAIGETRFGKHEGLSVISQRFSWVRRYVPYEDFFVFGMMRDPVDWLLSLYNSHTKADFDGLPYSTKDMPFSRFLHEGFGKRWQMRPQHLRFTDTHGRFRMSHIMDFNELENEFPQLCARIGVECPDLRYKNKSPQAVSRDTLSADDINFIRDRYAADYEFFARRPRGL